MTVVLDISLGVFVVFLFLSLVVSTIGEAISTWFAIRYRQLRQGISSLLLQSGSGEIDKFFDQPLIKALRSRSKRKRQDLPRFSGWAKPK